MSSPAAAAAAAAAPAQLEPAETSASRQGSADSGAAAQDGGSWRPGRKQPRNRIRYSCTTCRDKKLKCDRQLPCDQCSKRSLAGSCEYVPYLFPKASARANGARARHARSTPPDVATLQNRLRQLERLVQVLKSPNRDDAAAARAPTLDPTSPDPDAAPSEAESQLVQQQGDVNASGKSRLQDAPGWETMLNEIEHLTHDLRAAGEVTGEPIRDDVEPKLPEKRGPILLLGAYTATKADLLHAVPNKALVDQMFTQFFERTSEPAWSIYHIPSFVRAYETFWQNPSEGSVTFLGLLYGIIAHTALLCHLSNEPIPGNLGKPIDAVALFVTRMAHCLAADDYTSPGKWKIEALMSYFAIEYLRLSDAQAGNSILLPVLVRCAMHMGYHRDPRHNSALSPFEGEMRRRVWKNLVQIDSMVAFQHGVPPMIAPDSYDTEPPRNLMDEDFDETSTELPEPRPLTEQTRILPIILKGKIDTVFTDIQITIFSTKPCAYEQIMELDRKLRSRWESIPPGLRMRSFAESEGEPIDLVMQRYSREILYQKCRSVLHRRYLNLGRTDYRYSYSRWTCLDSAATTMRHQYDIHRESEPGGRVANNNWLQNSLLTHDFLLAAMILCLELSYILHSGPTASGNPPHQNFTKDQLLEMLDTSRKIWEKQRKESTEAQRAFRIISSMLAMATGMDFELEGNSTDGQSVLQQPSAYQVPQSYESPLDIFNATRVPNTTTHPSTTAAASTGSIAGGDWGNLRPAPPSMAARPPPAAWPAPHIVGSIDPVSADNLDWSMWDNQIGNLGSEMPQLPWNYFFKQL